MLKSSAEYLQALRTKNFLRFLEWPEFIVQHYQKNGRALDYDEIMNLLVFDWINNGYCEEDARLFALLFAVDNSNTELIRGKISSALAQLVTANYQCMALVSMQVISRIKVNKPLNHAQINELIASIGEVDAGHLKVNQIKFLEWVATIDITTITMISQKINAVVRLRYLVEEYDLKLTGISQLEGLDLARSSLVSRLLDYLNEQMELTATVQETITEYVKKIWQLQPSHSEHYYLQQLDPGSIWDNSWRFIASLGRFFNKLELLPAAVESKDLQQPKP